MSKFRNVRLGKGSGRMEFDDEIIQFKIDEDGNLLFFCYIKPELIFTNSDREQTDFFKKALKVALHDPHERWQDRNRSDWFEFEEIMESDIISEEFKEAILFNMDKLIIQESF